MKLLELADDNKAKMFKSIVRLIEAGEGGMNFDLILLGILRLAVDISRCVRG